MTKKKPLIILTGPTAVGKTNLSITLAKAIGGEIISADSMQVYRNMDIGSAKITEEEMSGVPHHLFDIIEPWEEFNVTIFQKLAKKAMNEIYEQGNIPIVVGGTGFYIQALLYDIDFTENEDNSATRKKYEDYLKQAGVDALFEKLQSVDPESCEIIHKNNTKRVIRALEYYELTGEKISLHNKTEQEKESPYQFIYFVLTDDRELLYRRIDERVDIMVKNGLVEEVKKLVDLGCRREMVSMQGLGYKEILDFLEGNSTLEESVYVIKRDTRHFAKRQLTWFRRERDVVFINKAEYRNKNSNNLEEEMLSAILELLKEKQIT